MKGWEMQYEGWTIFPLEERNNPKYGISFPESRYEARRRTWTGDSGYKLRLAMHAEYGLQESYPTWEEAREAVERIIDEERDDECQRQVALFILDQLAHQRENPQSYPR